MYLVVGYHGLKWNGKDLANLENILCNEYVLLMIKLIYCHTRVANSGKIIKVARNYSCTMASS